MIVLRDLTKIFALNGQRKVVLDAVNVTFPSGVSVGILGRNGSGKSTLLQLISGSLAPTSGQILSDGQISYPVGFAGSFHGDLTGAQNTRFVARIYGVDTDDLMDFVEDFSELGSNFYLPVRTYSSGMKSRLSFGVSMGIAFDTYLVDEITAVGDASFKRKSSAIFNDRMKTAGSLFVSHSIGQVRELCQAGAVIEGGRLHYYDDVDEAIERHLRNMED